MGIPVDPAVKLPALSAEDDLRETVIAGKPALLAGRPDMHGAAADQFLLYAHKNVFWDDGLVVVLHVILRHDALTA